MNLLVVGGILFPCVYWDLRRKCIPLWWIFAGSIIALFIGFICKMGFDGKSMAGAAVGMIVLLVAFFTRQREVGYGDGWFLTISGFLLGLEENLSLLFYGLLITALFAIGLLFAGKASRQTELPFFPFLAVSWLMICLQGVF